MKNGSKDIYNLIKVSVSNKCCSFELSSKNPKKYISWFAQKY